MIEMVATPARKVLKKETPVHKLSDLILGEAMRDRADSIRFRLDEQDTFAIDFHVDGEWKTINPPPRRLLEPLLGNLLLAHEYGPNGIPLAGRGPDAVAKLEVNDITLTIALPTDTENG